MCAIYGGCIRKVNDRCIKLLSNLFIQSIVRGQKSFGFSLFHPDFDLYCDNNAGYEEVLRVIDSIPEGALFIGHCRYSTSGDTGQPITRGEITLAFNGNIHMGTKEEMESYFDLKLITDNDGEVFLIKYLTGEHIQLINDPSVSFFGAWIKHNGLFLMRNERRPGYIYREEDNTFFCSTRDILWRAGGNSNNAISVVPYRENCLGAV